MRFVIFNRDYPAFLRDLYLSRPGLQAASYAEQLAVRNHSLFGVADFYSENFKAHGHEAVELHLNNPWLQYAWAREHGLKVAPPQPQETLTSRWNRHRVLAGVKRRLRRVAKRFFAAPAVVPAPAAGDADWENLILRAQIEELQPDVVLNQEMAAMRSPVLKSLKTPGMLVMGQIASSLPEDDPFDAYDMVISSLPNQVAWFQARGVRAELNRLAFEPFVFNRLGPQPARDIELSFVGSLSHDHVKRIAFLEHVATHAPLKVWGNGIERLPQSSPLHACYQGEAWGRDMYEILRRSKITLNFHIDLAEDWANNLRLYEATGMGTLLLTDSKRNLAEMFVPGEHVAAYADAEDCVRQIHALLADDARRERIAAAGQQHAIKTQNYFLRTREIAGLAETLRSKS
jgi:hypothetical protein